MKIKGIITKLEKKFPRFLAESWDNVGLLIGDKNREVEKIQLSLDVTEEAIDNAIANGVNLIISHHPLIFSPLKQVNGDSLTGRKVLKLIENKIALYSMHTNLDSAYGGLNDYVAKKLSDGPTKIMDEQFNKLYKLSFYIPLEIKEKVEKLIYKANINLDKWEAVSYSHESLERYYLNGKENTNSVIKISVIGKRGEVASLWNRIRDVHPYEEPAYEIIETENKISDGGLGRVIEVKDGLNIYDYIKKVKDIFQVENCRAVISEEKVIKKVAIVNGGGASFINKALKLKADLYITGDIKHHEASDAREMGLNILDLGHFETEHFFGEIIEEELKDENLEVIFFNGLAVFKYC